MPWPAENRGSEAMNVYIPMLPEELALNPVEYVGWAPVAWSFPDREWIVIRRAPEPPPAVYNVPMLREDIQVEDVKVRTSDFFRPAPKGRDYLARGLLADSIEHARSIPGFVELWSKDWCAMHAMEATGL